MSIEFSLVCPCYNESRLIESSVERIREILPKITQSYEIILVNDGSADETWPHIEKLASRYPEVRGLNRPHYGKGGALTAGFKEAKGELSGFIDIDLEIKPEYLTKLVECARKGYDIVVGSKVAGKEAGKNRSFTRQLSTRIYNTMVLLMLNSRVKDHQAGIKVFKRRVLDTVLPRMESVGWIWDTEFLVRAQAAGFSIAETPITISHQRVSKVNVPLDSAKMFMGVLRLFRLGLRVPRGTHISYNVIE